MVATSHETRSAGAHRRARAAAPRTPLKADPRLVGSYENSARAVKRAKAYIDENAQSGRGSN